MMERGKPHNSDEKLTGALVRIFGPPAEELAAIFHARLKSHRWKQSLRIIEEAKAECERRRIEFRLPPLKFIVPFFEQASLEHESEREIVSMWANLLVSTINDFQSRKVAYISVLERISSDDAKFLKTLFERVSKDGSYNDFDPDFTRSRDQGDIDSFIRQGIDRIIEEAAPNIREVFDKPGLRGERFSHKIVEEMKRLGQKFGTRADIIFARYSIAGFLNGRFEWSISGNITNGDLEAAKNVSASGLLELMSCAHERSKNMGRNTHRLGIAISYYWLNSFGLEFLKSCIRGAKTG